MHDNFGEDENKPLKKFHKKKKKYAWSAQGRKKYLRKQNNKRKKANHDNLDNNKTEQLRRYEKEVKRVVCINFSDEKKSI